MHHHRHIDLHASNSDVFLYQALDFTIHSRFPPPPGTSSAVHRLFALSPARLRQEGAFMEMRRSAKRETVPPYSILDR